MLKPGPTRVITGNVALTVPIVSTVVVNVSLLEDAVCRTHTVCPLVMVPAKPVKGIVSTFEKNPVVQPMAYSPPVMLIGAAPLNPVICTLYDTCNDDGVTPATRPKSNGLGVNTVAHGAVVTLNTLATPAIVTVAEVVVLHWDAVVRRTVIV